ncbi:Bor family protein [Flavobacteriaceae bacterium]|nr:Bor family protein [Flavobacteriaceae bacterium]MDB2366091.1 Bor family protein [Flavobacteriaceae bacterium]MDC0559770.1 Bor family protein [Flavobacteriaceae bacterium]
MRKTLLIILIFFLLTSCSVHTFTYGDGPKQGYTKVLKQHNFVGGLISDTTPNIGELNGETDYKLVVKHSIVDSILSFLSFGLYTPTTITIYR